MPDNLRVNLVNALATLDVTTNAAENGISVQLLQMVNGVLVSAGDVIHLTVDSGVDGREIELRKTDTELQWHYVGEDTWRTLVLLSEFSKSAFKAYDVLQSFPTIGDSSELYLDKNNAKLYFWDAEAEHYVNISIPDFDILDPNEQ